MSTSAISPTDGQGSALHGPAPGIHDPAGTRRVVLAAALGTVFEWYDFFIYGSLAAFFGVLFFPPGNETAAFLASLATFGAGFVLRPFGALVFGRLGDVVGRKRTFLITMLIMGVATAVVGLLPTFAQIGWCLPPPAARPGGRRRVRRCRHLRGGTRLAGTSRLPHELDPNHRDRRPPALAPRHPRVP